MLYAYYTMNIFIILKNYHLVVISFDLSLEQLVIYKKYDFKSKIGSSFGQFGR